MVVEEERVEGAGDEGSDDEIDAMPDKDARTVENEVEGPDEGPEEPRSFDEIIADAERPLPAVARSRPGRPLVFAIGATGLIMLVALGFVAIVATAGPELLGDRPGGELDINVTADCGTMFGKMKDACFRSADLSVMYPSGERDAVALENHPLGWHATMELVQARATIEVQTEQGIWTREVWVPQGTRGAVQIDAEDQRTVAEVIGRDIGLGFYFGAGGLLALVLFAATLGWWWTENPVSATIVRGALVLAIAHEGLFAVIELFRGQLGIGRLILILWFSFLAVRVSRWIASGRRTDIDPLEPTHEPSL